jgi:hypothetical protein
VASATDAQALAGRLSGSLPHVGPFRAYELATSMTYSEHLPALRESQLFHVGPGSVGGLEMLTGTASHDRASFEALRSQVIAELPRGFRWIPASRQGGAPDRYKFTLRTLEDSMCEFRKYRVLSGDRSTSATATRRRYRQMDIAA